VCPFCGSAQTTITSSTLDALGAFGLTVMLLGSTACAKDPMGTDTTTEESGSTTTGESGQEETTSTDTGDTADDTFNTTGSFYAGPPIDFDNSACDPFLQDCNEGEKCVPYSSIGGIWDANKCVPVTGSGAPGDPCVYGGTIDATDDCGPDSHCWDVIDVDGVPMGVCTEFCQGTPDDPICPADTVCLIAFQGSMNLCVEPCDPVAQNCDPGFGCYWSGGVFACLQSAQDVPIGEPCGSINDCAVGLDCTDAELLPSCIGDSCCASFCSLAAPVCPQMGTECTPFFEEGFAPPGYTDVGICIAPA
jgi:hypothetical protein